MSIPLPPPLPNQAGRSSQLPPPPGSGVAGKGNGPVIRPEDREPASSIPLVLALVALILSTILVFFRNLGWAISLIGYLLTPFSIILLSGLDAILQRKGASTKVWFLPNPKFATYLRLLSFFSLVIAYFHVNSLADFLSVLFGKML